MSVPLTQSDLVGRICLRSPHYAWFLGAGASRATGLPTATDIIWDIKRRYYCREENQDISRQDLQNEAVRNRLQAYFDARGFPPLGAPDEYTAYFERVFGEDRERQRNYIRAVLSEDRASLAAGNRVFGAMLAANLVRVAFTTNFDNVVEKAAAEIGHRPLAPYHLEGARAANTALDNEDYPLYCKLHGDFRHDSLKNLSADLRRQNDDLARCLVNAAGRFGFVVAGYSGRDDSIMELFHRALDTSNPFPHGLYWTVMRTSPAPAPVAQLISRASSQGVEAHIVETQTFDAFMLHVWRNLDSRPAELDSRVRRSALATVDIPLPPPGDVGPPIRTTALPILEVPSRCQTLSFTTPKEWADLRRTMASSNGALILAKSKDVWAWGSPHAARSAIGPELTAIGETQLPTGLHAPGGQFLKGFFERALARSLARGRPLLSRTRHQAAYVIANRHAPSLQDLDSLAQLVGQIAGTIAGLETSPTPDFPDPEPVHWAEALRLVVHESGDQLQLLVHPDIWIWPPRARRDAQDFMAHRRRGRFNQQYNQLLDAWLEVVLGPHKRRAEVEVSPFDSGAEPENPRFVLGTRTAYSRRLRP